MFFQNFWYSCSWEMIKLKLLKFKVVQFVWTQLIPVETDRKTAPHLCPSFDGQQLLGLSSPVPRWDRLILLTKVIPSYTPTSNSLADVCNFLNIYIINEELSHANKWSGVRIQLASFITFSEVITIVKTNINYTKLQLVNLCLHIACLYLESYPISPLSYLI